MIRSKEIFFYRYRYNINRDNINNINVAYYLYMSFLEWVQIEINWFASLTNPFRLNLYFRIPVQVKHFVFIRRHTVMYMSSVMTLICLGIKICNEFDVSERVYTQEYSISSLCKKVIIIKLFRVFWRRVIKIYKIQNKLHLTLNGNSVIWPLELLISSC